MSENNPFDPPQSFSQSGQQGQPMPPGAPAPVQPPKRSWFARHKILTGLAALIVVGIIAAVAGGGSGEDAAENDGSAPAATEEAAAPEDGVDDAGDGAATGDAAASDASTSDTGGGGEETSAGIGTPVRDGNFEFTVTGVEAGVTDIGNDVIGEQAQGQFVLVSVTVTNIGDEAQSFSGDNCPLFDSEGREHSADVGNSIYLEDSNSIYTEVNPGNTMDAVVLYDIPADATPASIELHDSMFSGGVTVSLQ